jgi:hypothetical protein
MFTARFLVALLLCTSTLACKQAPEEAGFVQASQATASTEGLCECYSDTGAFLKSKCMPRQQCGSFCGIFTPRFLSNHSACRPAPQPAPAPPTPTPDPAAVTTRGPTLSVAPCTSETCNECCYHNSGEPAAMVPENGTILGVRNYISGLYDPNSPLHECTNDSDCEYSKFEGPPRITRTPPRGWTGGALPTGHVFVSRYFKNWSHNRVRTVQIEVIYKQ